MADVLALKDSDLLESVVEGAGDAVEAAGDVLVAAGEALVDTATSRRGRTTFLGLILLALLGVVVWKLLERRKSGPEAG